MEYVFKAVVYKYYTIYVYEYGKVMMIAKMCIFSPLGAGAGYIGIAIA